MSTYVLMRILESAPRRYDFGIRLLTLGHLEPAYDRLAGQVRANWRVLDVGCGTGALTLRAARRGAWVRGIDINPRMLEIAAQRVREAGLERRVKLVEMGVAELDGEQEASYEAVTAGLCFSELGDGELDYTLKQVARILVPGGLLLAADEVRPENLGGRLARALCRAPLVALTWVLTQQTTRAIPALASRVTAAGLTIESSRATALGGFVELVARKRREVPA